ncbi:primosomal protein N' [Lederbergia galactosidilytica]|uniref:Replication restart protein PriA n=1 Tax=Lederbergia galactosidilytica TaxID=217031 RepID=A0A177ZZ64_9BACI|nr:primosomal protein N' [Lederbergia galactosidilytica]OAK72600.1 primosomal protein N' [Lederbergia galactosidilytica]
MIAEVIVDVPALGTDKVFDYVIPEKWLNIVEPGMRVAVPFGPRLIQGFVMEVKRESSLKKLKEIKELLDLTPVLNKELLGLGQWIANETLSFKISAFHAMLPAAMKAKYEKYIRRTKLETDPELESLFLSQEKIAWKEAENREILPKLREQVNLGNAEVIYDIKDRAKKKTMTFYTTYLREAELIAHKNEIRANATAQRKLIFFLMEHSGENFTTQQLIELSGTSSTAIQAFVKKGILQKSQDEIYRDPFAHKEFERTLPLTLTEEQQKAITPILSRIEADEYQTFLLYGVTGSGKTEIYLQSIQKVLEKGKEAIVLVPEISLTPQMVDRFKGRFGDDVAVLHSGLSLGEKYDEWRKIQRKEAKVVVGARSAIFAPLENIGIMIIDEEHETSYKQEEQPRYHARDVAIKRAENHQCPVILGSATPSLESFARAKKGVYHLLTLSKRMNEMALPSVSIVDMREEMRSGNRSMFSVELFEKLKDRLEKQEQTILFLNRRGHSSFLLCRDCGYVMQCPHCDISLTFHRFSNEMKCHYCGFTTGVPEKCPECTSQHIRYFGTGTQKVEEELNKVLPEARIIRMDVDTTSRKGAHEKLLDQFKSGRADILLGTQMIAKGLDFPNITLVGVLSADTMLNLPDFRAAEKTFQLLTQVSGRAGRHELTGEVVIQTYAPEHYSVQLAGQQNYDHFYQREMMLRKMGSYPPFYYLSLVTVSHEDLMKVISVTEKMAKFIRANLSEQAVILGPASSPIPRINDRYRYQCLIKYKHEPKLTQTLKRLVEHYQQQYNKEGLTISIDVNPYNMM